MQAATDGGIGLCGRPSYIRSSFPPPPPAPSPPGTRPRGLRAAIPQRATGVLLIGLRQPRASLRLAITGRDKRLPPMREVRDFDIPGPASELPSRIYRPMSAPEHGGPVLVYI